MLEDDVLRLRPLTLDDVVPWLAGEDEEIRKWFQQSRPSSRPDVTRAIQAWKRSWAEGGPVRYFGVCSIEGDTLVGGVEVRDRGEGVAYLTYLVFPEHRRKGHATRAVRQAADYATQDLSMQRLVLIIDEANAAARGVAEAAGFTLDGPADPSEHVEMGEMLRYVRS